MDTLSYKTISANKATVTKEWVIVDATDQVLGRLGAKVAKLLRGKYKPNFTPHVDCGDNVIIINADKVKISRFMQYFTLGVSISPCISPASFNSFRCWETVALAIGNSSWMSPK